MNLVGININIYNFNYLYNDNLRCKFKEIWKITANRLSYINSH